MKRVVITGADGFVGRHLCREFAADGWQVFAFVRAESCHRECLEGLANVQLVVCDYSRMGSLQGSELQEPDAFVHLAWAGVIADERNNFSLQKENIDLSVSALRYAIGIGAKKFVLPGSTFEYSQSGKTISGIDDIPTPQNAYGAAKVAARYLCEFLAKQQSVPFVYTIFSSSYGADRRDRNVIHYVIDSLLRKKSPDLTGLEQLWDYVHIDDLVRGIVAVCENGRPCKCYPIGHGDNMPLRNYIEIIHQLIDPDLPLGIGRVPYPPGKFPCSCVDMTELTRDTGYVPRIDFKDGVAEVIEAERKFLCL